MIYAATEAKVWGCNLGLSPLYQITAVTPNLYFVEGMQELNDLLDCKSETLQHAFEVQHQNVAKQKNNLLCTMYQSCANTQNPYRNHTLMQSQNYANIVQLSYGSTQKKLKEHGFNMFQSFTRIPTRSNLYTAF